MAQSVERILGKDEVPSSILGISTIYYLFYVLCFKLKPKTKCKEFYLATIALWTHLISIPNSEVKGSSVDGSVGLPHVRVEHRQVLI